MTEKESIKLLFIINPRSGSNTTDWAMVINDYFKSSNHTIELFHLTKHCNVQTIKEKIKLVCPERVIAVGGDGTVALVAECLIELNIPLGILPAGSANGLAKELGISDNSTKTLDLLIKGHSKKIHVVKINDQLCIHLSDIGLNAHAMKKFKSQNRRGMWGYLKASLKVLWHNPIMDVEIKIDTKTVRVKAEMIVIANATKYGSGVVINPVGTMEDDLFEVIAIKKISLREIFKMTFFHSFFDADRVEIFQTKSLYMHSKKKVHFQVDGEYLGRVHEINATIIPGALQIIIPSDIQ